MSNKGVSIHRLTADQIAARRAFVRKLDANRYSTAEIRAALLDSEVAFLLAGQKDQDQVIRNDLEVLAAEDLDYTRKTTPLARLTLYESQQAQAAQYAWEMATDPSLTPNQRAMWLKLYMDASQNHARAGGVPVDKPAVIYDFNAQIAMVGGLTGLGPAVPGGDLIEGEVVSGGRASSFGQVDAYTFATHEDYCALDLTDKPMEAMILNDFLKPGSGYNELIAICGMRSGKGTVGSVAVWYMIYRLLELASPQRYYGLALGQTISTVNMALSEPQAKANVFKHIKDRLDHGGRWFQELRAFCENSIPNYNVGLEIRLPKDLAMRCGHSRAKSLVGGTNIAVVFDELCKYKTSDGADNAESVYTQMKATTATFGEASLVMSISSPEWEGDYGMTLLGQAIERDDSPIEDRCEECRIRAEQPHYIPSPTKSHPRMYGLQLPTWEANTALTYERLFDTMGGAKNPRAFWRDFGARPATTIEGYYPDPERWDRQPDPDLKYPYDSNGVLADWFKPCCDSRRFVHVDLAVSRDAAGIAMAHKPVPGCPWYETITTSTGVEANPKGRKVVIDVCVQLKPETKPNQTVVEIDFEAIRDMIYEWQDRKFKIKDGRITYDGFQSVDSRQMLRKKGFRATEFSVDRDLKAHDTLQELVNTDQIAFPRHSVLIREGKQLQLKNGRKVDHPPKGSKDVIDAVAGSSYHAATVGGRRGFIGGTAPAQADN